MCASAGDRGRVADGGPSRGVIEMEGEPGFQVRLVKAWKSHAGVHGNKQSAEVLIAVVLVFKARDGLAGGRGVAGERERECVPATPRPPASPSRALKTRTTA